MARLQFVKNISCSKHEEEEAIAPCEEEFGDNVGL